MCRPGRGLEAAEAEALEKSRKKTAISRERRHTQTRPPTKGGHFQVLHFTKIVTLHDPYFAPYSGAGAAPSSDPRTLCVVVHGPSSTMSPEVGQARAWLCKATAFRGLRARVLGRVSRSSALCALRVSGDTLLLGDGAYCTVTSVVILSPQIRSDGLRCSCVPPYKIPVAPNIHHARREPPRGMKPLVSFHRCHFLRGIPRSYRTYSSKITTSTPCSKSRTPCSTGG